MKYIVFVSLSISLNFLIAQNEVSNEKILELSKREVIRLNNSLGVIDSSKYHLIDSLLSTDIFKCKFLKSEGFKLNIKFVEVSFSEDDFMTFLIDDYNPENKLNIYMKFVLAYDTSTNRFYRLKGFLNNDFKIFVRMTFRLFLSKGNKKIRKSKIKKFLKVESLDIKCLANNMNNINDWEKPCLKPAPSRLISMKKGHYIIQ